MHVISFPDPPKAEPSFREVDAKEGSSVNLTVAFSASPEVNFSSLKWFNGNGFVQSGSFLSIQEVKRSDAGNYTWEARNTLTPSQGAGIQGFGQATIRLRVLCKYFCHLFVAVMSVMHLQSMVLSTVAQGNKVMTG